MTRILTPEELVQKLNNLKADAVPAIERGMKNAAYNVEAKARENCTPGKSPYYRAPYSDDNDPKRVPPHMRDVMYNKVTVTGNKVSSVFGNPKPYAAAVHEGTSRMQARPFILDAIKAEDRTTRIHLTDAIMQSLQKECV